MTITAEELRQLVSYNPETGIFTWLQSKFQPYRIGQRAGSVTSNGYRRIFLGKKTFTEHRLAWLYITGEWPKQHIDHINGNPLDNRFCNLRQVSRFGNMQNIRSAKANNKSGFLGVSAHQGKWVMQIMTNGKTHRKSGFDTPEEAHQAYLKAKRSMHPTCTV